MRDVMEAPPFSASRLTLLVTGSVSAALVPYWLHWLRQVHPGVTTNVLVTRSAERFVTLDAARHLVPGHVWRDSWDEPTLPGGSHVGIETLTDCYGVFPATLDCLSRLASGAGSTPALLALQTTEKPIGICASLPGSNPIVEQNVERLGLRPNVGFVGAVPAFSVGTQSWSGRTGFFLPGLLETLERLLTSGADARSTEPTADAVSG